MKNRFKILISPLFILGLGLLLLNDFYLKAIFGNWWTGKFSDLSGIFIFPLFLTTIFPKRKIACFIGASILFILWKIPLSDPLIRIINEAGIPIGRTVDISDFIALTVVPLAYIYQRTTFTTLNIKPQFILVLSGFAFIATSLPPQTEKRYISVDKTYHFDFSRDVLIDRLNRITAEKISKQPRDAEISFDSENNLFYYSKWSHDTLAILLDSRKIEKNDTIHYETVLADFVIEGNDSISSLTFINAYKTVPAFSDKDYRKKAIKEFERRVIRKMK